MSDAGLVIGSYRVLSELGQGGMGVVYLARDAQGREVALKVLNEGSSSSEELLARFDREARISLELKHANIVRTLDRGVANGMPYIVSEYLPGGNLGALLKTGALEEPRTIEIAVALFSALHAIERAHLVHRDVKPDNILFDGSGTPKLGDLGFARPTSAPEVRHTKTGQILGTPSYMSPEQIDGVLPLDIRTDLYAAGVVLFECLTGMPPFTGKSSYAIIKQHLAAPPPDVRTVAPNVSVELATIISSLLAKSRDERPASAAVVLEKLQALAPKKRARHTPAATDLELAVPNIEDLESVEVNETFRVPLRQGSETALSAAALHFEGPKGAHVLFVYVGTGLRLGREAEGGNSVAVRVRPTAGNEKLNQRISRKHCEIVYSKTGPAIIDLGSRGGTKLDNKPLQPNIPAALPRRGVVTIAQALVLTARVLPQPLGDPYLLDGRPARDSTEEALLLERPTNGSDHAYLLVPGRVSLAAPPGAGLVPGLPGDTELCSVEEKLWLRTGGFGGTLWGPLTDGLRFLVEGTKVTARAIQPEV